MIIYGTALLAFCHLAGLFIGDLLGIAIGVKTNVGGVGIAMLLLIFLRLYLHKKGLLPKETEAGVGFWGAMYIPVVVAMAANQNVVAALKGGPVALLSALGGSGRLRMLHRRPVPHRSRQHVVRQRAAPRRNLKQESVMLQILDKNLIQNGLVTAFALVGLIMWVSSLISRKLTFGRVHGSAIAIVIGLVLAYVGGAFTGGQKGLADLPLFTGIGLMGGAMLRDFAIVATAFEVQATEARKAGMIGVLSLLLGTVLPFIVGASIAYAFGYTDPVSMTTIGAGAVTYIVGPVTGAAIGASSDVIALSIATGLIKAIIVMIGTPLAAGFMGLKTPRSAMIFGGLAGTVSGVSAGLAATDRRLVPTAR